jgi:pimeloyl-ACP methyl ester carboxylesterase
MQHTIAGPYSKLTYSVYGRGKTIVFIHGFGEDYTIWNKQVDYLQSNFKLIVPSLAGTGESSLYNNLSIESMAQDIKAILDAENTDQCIMLGHSMGGYITLAFAEQYPALLSAFGLIHSTAYADSEEKKQARKKSIDFINQNSATEFIKATIPNLFGEKFKQLYPEKVNELIEQGKQFSKETLVAYYNAMIDRKDRTHVLKQSTVPVLFFIGEEDKAVNPADAIAQTALPTVCHAELIKDIGHMGMWEATEQLNHTIDKFIQFVNEPKTQTVTAELV